MSSVLPVKYSRRAKILLGCHRKAASLKDRKTVEAFVNSFFSFQFKPLKYLITYLWILKFNLI